VTYTQGVVLGLVQGLTEFLPVSSSGHLILVPHVFGWPDQGLAFDAVMHLGTLAALLAYFRRELLDMASGALSRRLAALLILATIPGALAGVFFEKLIESKLRSPLVIAVATAGWAIVMWIADRRAAGPPGGAARPARARFPRPGPHGRLRPGAGADSRHVALGHHDHGRALRRPRSGDGRALRIPARHSDHGRRRIAEGASTAARWSAAG
jgi:uncharacterized membrane protein YfcA